jgi:hypothetical protein
MSDTPELALLAAINVLRDSIETGHMPSGIELAPEALAMHEPAITECERLLGAAREARA